MNDIQKGWSARDDYFVSEILRAKARFVHCCLAAIMPKELYDLASKDNQMPRCEKWAKEQGYQWREVHGETQLMKGPVIVGRFTPRMVGKGAQQHCEFDANIFGKRVPVVLNEPALN